MEKALNRKLRIGVMGGGRGSTMIKELAGHPDAELVAVCDKYAPLLDDVKGWADEHGLPVACFTDFEDFLAYDMDAVVLANYATEHATFAMRCLRAGKHVMSEVLPCETMAQAVELVETVEETGLVYAYAENYCYMDAPFEMWQRYKKGDIGEIQYGEGSYIHDCSAIWPQITYGEKDHWRNTMYATYYCTHSLGPLLAISGLRPVKVVGYELPVPETDLKLGITRGTGIEMVTLENGAVMRSIHGHLKREPGDVNYMVFGKKGMMESGRMPESSPINVYEEGEFTCVGDWSKYQPDCQIAHELRTRMNMSGHGGSDFYATHFFIEKILGRPDGQWSLDIYQALDMGICGILAYRSILNGNQPVAVPDLRDKAQRDAWRNDHACTTVSVAGDQLLPSNSLGYPVAEDAVFDHLRDLWKQGLDGNEKPTGYYDGYVHADKKDKKEEK